MPTITAGEPQRGIEPRRLRKHRIADRHRRGLSTRVPRHEDRYDWGRHTTLAVVIAGLIFSVIVFMAVRQQTTAHLADSLGVQAGRTTETYQRHIRVVEDSVRALGALFGASRHVTGVEFSGFVDHILPDTDGIDLLFWASPSTGSMVSPYSVGPLAKESHLTELDRDPNLHALIAAALNGRPLTTAVIDCVALGLADNRLLAVAVPTRRSQNGAVTGAVIGMMAFDKLFRRQPGDNPGIWAPAVRVYDPDSPDIMLYGSEPDHSIQLTVLIGPVIQRTRLVLGDRVWIAQFQGEVLNLPPLLAFAPAGTLFGSLIMTAVLAAYLSATQRRARDVRAMASSLERANHELQRRIDQHHHTATALGESERKYRDIYENAIEGIFQTSPEGRMLSANPALARIYGYETPDEVLEALQDVSQHLYVDAARRMEFVRQLERQEVIYSFESEIMRKDGKLIWIDETARAVRDSAGRLLYYEGKVEDITERKAADEAMRMAKEQADFANRAKTEFLANMSHELRTPLNAVIGFAEIIKDEMFGPAGRPEYVEYARDIHDSGRLLLELINDILDMSKIEAGKKELQDSVIDIGRVALSSVRLVHPRAELGCVAIEVDLPPDLPAVRAEELSMKQIVTNLLTNAVKFTPEGGKVLLSAKVEADGQIAMSVADTGIGIAAEDMDKALAPFGQIESSLSNKTQGTGLGLPLVKALVHLHGGTLTLDSTRGSGTTVTIRLPADRVIRQVA
jgi:PAS domain S-box-containing protein